MFKKLLGYLLQLIQENSIPNTTKSVQKTKFLASNILESSFFLTLTIECDNLDANF